MDEQSIFLEALQKETPEERAAFLAEACGDDEAIRHEIEMLLKAHNKVGDFLQGAPAGIENTLDQPITEKPGTQIGPYKLLQQLGEGGMGVVYMAEQKEPVKRRVALKIIKPGMDTRQVIARFEAERQALAMMDHPNIAKVLDAGQTESGRPYFVMELVNGLPVTKYCDEQHLTPKERLEIFVPICQAVQHAHQKGIIHRDLKPSNILVALYDGQAVPKIIDFGVAKATSQTLTEKTMFTQLGQVVGTLEYMSPEQAERNQLDIDTRSDIYSLGVVLYELLTGETPFDRARLRSAAFDEMLRIIREEEPSKPSTKVSSSLSLASIAANRRIEPAKLGSLMRGELDWIVLKAMEKDRGRRYETASKFAEDVQHYLNDEAVIACPPSAAYRFKKLVRRNKVAIGVAAIIGAALLSVVGAISWGIRDRIAREQLAQQEREARQHTISQAAENALADSNRFLSEMNYPQALADARRAEATLAGGAVTVELQQEIARLIKGLEMVARLEQIRLETSTLREYEFDWASSDQKYAQAFREYGIDVENFNAQAAAEHVRHRLVAAELAVALDDWVYVRRKARGPAGTSWQGLVTVATVVDPDAQRCRLRSLWGQEATDEARNELTQLAAPERLQGFSPTTLDLLARTLDTGGLSEESLRVLQYAVQLYPDDFWLHFDAARACEKCSPPRRDEAILHYTAALAIRPSSVAVLNELGNALCRQGKLDEAIARYRKAIEIEPKFAMAHSNLGIALADQKKLDEAIACYRKAIEIDPKYAYAHVNLGNALNNRGNLDEVIVCYRKAIEIDPNDADVHRNLGIALGDQGKLDEAIACYRKAIEIDPKHAKAYDSLGFALWERGKLDEAIACCRKAIEIDPKLAMAHSNLGIALADQKKLDEAIACYRKAIEIDPKLALALNNLGSALYGQGKLEEAVTYLRKAIEIDPKCALAYSNLGVGLKDQGKRDEAIACYRKAIELDFKLAFPHNGLGIILADQGKLVEAIACYRKAIELDPKFAFPHNNLGNALRDQGKLDGAIASYRKAIEIDPTFANAHNGLGAALAAQGKLDEAIAHYQKAVERDPNLKAVYPNLVWSLSTAEDVNLRNPAKAVEFGRKAVELEPENPNHWDNLGVALCSNQEYERAVEALEKARTMRGGKDPGHQAFLAMSYWKTGRRDEALAEYLQHASWLDETRRTADQYRFRDEAEKLIDAKAIVDYCTAQIDADSDSSGMFAARAAALARLGQSEAAAQDYDKALDLLMDVALIKKTGTYESLLSYPKVFDRLVEIRPDDAYLWILRGRDHDRNERWKEALADYERVSDPSNVDHPLVEYACLLLLNGQEERYRALCQRLEEEFDSSQSVDDAGHRVKICTLSPHTGVDPSHVMDWARKACEQGRDKYRVHQLGLAEYRAGHYQEAVSSLIECQELGLEVWKAAFPLALAYHQLGQMDESQRWFERGIAELGTFRSRVRAMWWTAGWLQINVWHREAKSVVESAATKAPATGGEETLTPAEEKTLASDTD